MAKVGRPSQFQERYVDEARKLALLGATDADMATFWGVTETTVNNWKQKNPEFLESLNAGKAAADANVADRLYQRAIGYSNTKAVKIFMPAGAKSPVYAPYTEHYPPDTTAAIFWLKNRRKADWRDKAEVEVTHRHDAANLTDDELAEIVASRRSGRTSEKAPTKAGLH